MQSTRRTGPHCSTRIRRTFTRCHKSAEVAGVLHGLRLTSPESTHGKEAFHLAWFLSPGYGPKSWLSDWPGCDLARRMMPGIFIDLAKGLDRCCFDYMIIEGSSMVPDTYRGSHDTYQICCQHNQARPSCTGAMAGTVYEASRPRADTVGDRVSAVSARTPRELARTRHRRTRRLKLRDGQQRWRRAELRRRRASSVRRALRSGRRTRRCCNATVGSPGGARYRGARPRGADVRRRLEGSSRSITRASTSRFAGRLTRHGDLRDGCRSCRPQARRVVSGLPRAGSIITDSGKSIASMKEHRDGIRRKAVEIDAIRTA